MTAYIYDAQGEPVGFHRDRFIYRLDGTPIPNYTVRIEKQAARTDAGGNFLLKHL